jgi:hypothetical protein
LNALRIVNIFLSRRIIRTLGAPWIVAMVIPPGILCWSSCSRLGRYTLSQGWILLRPAWRYTLLEVRFLLVLSDLIIRVIRVLAGIDLAVWNVFPLVGDHVASPLEVRVSVPKDKLGELSDKHRLAAKWFTVTVSVADDLWRSS